MKKIFFIAGPFLSIQIFLSCHSTKHSDAVSTAPLQKEAIKICEQTVKYKFSKVKIARTEEEKNEDLELIINPTDKIITARMAISAIETKSITYQIESMYCDLDAGLKDGYVIYRMIDHVSTEQKNEYEWTFEVKIDGVTVSFKQNGRENAIAKVDTWEIVQQ